MPDITVAQMTLDNNVVDADLVPYWKAGTGQQRRATRAALLGAAANAIVMNGNTAQLAQSGTIAMVDQPQTFIRRQIININETNLIPLEVVAPANSNTFMFRVMRGAITALSVNQPSGLGYLFVVGNNDFGTNAGSCVQIGQNFNSATPAAGHLLIFNRGNSGYRIWPDLSGNLRIGTTLPTGANDFSGTVVGAQTSAASVKDMMTGGQVTPQQALNHVLNAANGAIKRFRYKRSIDGVEASRPWNGEEFNGLVVDLAPRYGMDNGKSLNVVTAIGDIMLAIKALHERIDALEKK